MLIFRATQPPDRCPAVVCPPGTIGSLEPGGGVPQERLLQCCRWRVGIFWRHLSALDPVVNPHPLFEATTVAEIVLQGRQVEAATFRVGTVAVAAVLLEERGPLLRASRGTHLPG